MLNQLQFPGMPQAQPSPAEQHVVESVGGRNVLPEQQKRAEVLRQRMSQARPAIAFDPELTGDIVDWGFQNQHAVGDSNGSYDPELRRQEEERMFGIPSGIRERAYDDDEEEFYYSGQEHYDEGDPVEPHERPVYGFAWDSDKLAASVASQYGRAVAELKPHMREQATVANGDSLGSGMLPTTWRNAERGQFNGPLTADNAHYVEAQYHGGVEAGDIARVSFMQPMEQHIANPYASDAALSARWVEGVERRKKAMEDETGSAQAALEQADVPWRELVKDRTYDQLRMVHPAPGQSLGLIRFVLGAQEHAGLDPSESVPSMSPRSTQDWYTSRSWHPERGHSPAEGVDAQGVQHRKPYPVPKSV